MKLTYPLGQCFPVHQQIQHDCKDKLLWLMPAMREKFQTDPAMMSLYHIMCYCTLRLLLLMSADVEVFIKEIRTMFYSWH